MEVGANVDAVPGCGDDGLLDRCLALGAQSRERSSECPLHLEFVEARVEQLPMELGGQAPKGCVESTLGPDDLEQRPRPVAVERGR